MCFRRGLRHGQYGECSIYQAYSYSQKGGCLLWWGDKTVTRIDLLNWRPLYRLYFADGTSRTVIGYERIMCYRY